MNPQTECSIMNIPPELRNLIYRYTLIETEGDAEISIPASGAPPQHPPLLHTCRLIRKEATAIYFEENKFAFELRDFDNTRLRRWCGLSRQHRDTPVIFKFWGRPVWTNLLQWLEDYHNELCPGCDAAIFGSCNPMSIACRLFRFVDDQEERRETDWEELRSILEVMHQCLVIENPDWR